MLRWRNVAIFLSSLLISVFATDQVLGLIGFPPAPEIQVTHPKNFYERRENIEYEVDFRTNSQGLRNKEIPLEKPSKTNRIFILGDSFTEGAGVQNEEAFASKLEEQFSHGFGKKFEFINGGLSGTGPLEYIKLFYFVGMKYDPDAVLVCIYANDVSNTPQFISKINLYKKYEYDDENSHLKNTLRYIFPRIYTIIKSSFDSMNRETKDDDFVRRISKKAAEWKIPKERIDEWKQSLNDDFVDFSNNGLINSVWLSYPLLRPRYWTDAIDISSEKAERRFRSMSFILDEMWRVAEGAGVRLGLVFVPTRWQYDRQAHELDHPIVNAGMVKRSWLSDRTEIQVRLERWAAEHRVPFLDLTDRFREEAGKGIPLTYEFDGHWNPAGHSVAADAMKTWLRKLDWQFLEPEK